MEAITKKPLRVYRYHCVPDENDFGPITWGTEFFKVADVDVYVDGLRSLIVSLENEIARLKEGKA